MQNSDSPKEIIQGELQKLSYQNSENGWAVMRFHWEEKDSTITVVGHFGNITIGEYYQLSGEWVQHQSYGLQFKVSHWTQIYPSSMAGILRYLKSGIIKGVGEKTAERILEHFGTDTLRILDHNPERLLEIEKIGHKKKQDIIQAWNERKRFRDAEIFLSELGLSPHFIGRVVRMYGENAPFIIRDDPYRLSRDITGIGFITADQIATKLDIPQDSPLRVKAALCYQLELAEENGHCFQTREQLTEALCFLLKIPQETIRALIDEVILELTETGQIVFDEQRRETISHDIYYLAKTFDAEETVARSLANLLDTPFIPEPEERIQRYLQSYSERSGQNFSEEQLEAVCKAVRSRIFILTGGPGVGKTTTANAIIRLLVKMNKTVALGAPTGRAAQRLSEVAAIGAKTIHRLLEWSAIEHRFLRDEANPLEAQVIIIDEASMLDIHLAAALIRALPKGAQLIFIGDVDQLPSVGPGNVLRDLIESGVIAYTKLSKIFRQSSGSSIVQVAHQINRGEVPDFHQQSASDCQLLLAEDPADIKNIIKELISKTIPEKAGFDAVRDIQVLTPMNRGPLGAMTLNQELQDLLNPKADTSEKLDTQSQSFRPGDKVIQTVNNYDLNVFNGDIGFVEHAGFDGGQILVNFGDRKVSYTKEDAYDLKLAYAITIHKSQGSEFPVIIIPVTLQHYIMLQRNLIYTAITRARRLTLLVGTLSALQQAIKTQTSLKRQTQLVSRLQTLERRTIH